MGRLGEQVLNLRRLRLEDGVEMTCKLEWIEFCREYLEGLLAATTMKQESEELPVGSAGLPTAGDGVQRQFDPAQSY